jgi:hypothetical protein
VGKLNQAIAIMTRYKIDTLGMSEVRWNEFGEIKTTSNMLFLYSGRPNAEDEHREGVGLLLSKRMAACFLEWKPVTERIITARFQGHACNVTIIQCCAPTEAAVIETKQSFYAQVQEIYNKIKKKTHCHSHGRSECASRK